MQPSHFFNGTIDEVRLSNVARFCPESWDVSDNLTGHLYNGCLYQAIDVTHDGTYSLKMMPTGAAASTEFSTSVTPDITVKNRGKYKLSGWLRTDTDYNGSPEPQIVITSGGNTTTLTGGGNETHDTWKQYKGYITADDTTCTITLKAYGTQGSCWFDNIELIPAPTGTMIMIGRK